MGSAKRVSPEKKCLTDNNKVMKNIVFTTTNKNKLKSANFFLAPFDIGVISTPVEVDEIQVSDPLVLIRDKVEKCYNILKKPVVSMDSGIFIEELGGFPGVYTKYIINTIGEDGLINLMKDKANKSAYVQRTIGYTDGNDVKVFFSRGYGKILLEKRGSNGWNYDFIFLEKNTSKTLAEMSDEEKALAWGDSWEQLGHWISNKK